MALFVDTAVLSEVAQALTHPVLAGVTTNPTLVARALADKGEGLRTEAELYRTILQTLSPAQKLFIQLRGERADQMVSSFAQFQKLSPEGSGRVVAKIPATWVGMEAVVQLKQQFGAPVCVTAVFSPAQAYTAALAGADYIAVYVNRFTRAGQDSERLLGELHEAVDRRGSKVRILAASIKSPEEAARAVVAGADDLALPLDVLEMLLDHPMTAEALHRFSEDAKSIDDR